MEEENQSRYRNNGRWTEEEHERFLLGLEQFGKDWNKVAELVNTRSVVQVRTHAQKFFLRIQSGKRSQSPCLGVPQSFTSFQKAWVYHNMCALYYFNLMQSSVPVSATNEPCQDVDDSDSIVQSQEPEEDNRI